MNFQFTQIRQFYLSSNSNNATKNNGSYNSNIKYYIPNFIKTTDNILYNAIKLSHAEIPYSFYIINDTNNYFRVNSNNIYIPNGNYTGKTLLDEINKQLFNIDITLKMELNNSNGLITMRGNISFNIDMTKSLIYKVLGLEQGIYNAMFDVLGYSLTFTYPLDLLGTRNIYIKVNNLVIDNLNLTSNDKSTLKSIPVNVPPFGIIRYNNTENTETIIKNIDVEYLELEITDDYNNNINFNGIDWTICIEIKSLTAAVKNKQSIADILNQL